MEIKSIELVRLRNDAHFQLHKNTREFIVEAGPGQGGLKIEQLFATYEETIASEDVCLKKITKSRFTQEIREADKARDGVFIAIKASINASTKHYDPEIKEPARCLKIIVDTYGRINQKSYDEQTSAVYNMIQDFRSGGNPGHLAVIGISDMVDRLETANNLVRDLMRSRLEETLIKGDLSLREARTRTDKAYLDIRKRINAAIVIEGEENYADFVGKQNLNIDRYRLLLAKSKKRKGGGVPEEESEESGEG